MWGQEVHKELAPQAPDFQPGNVFSAVPLSEGVFLPKGQVRLVLITGHGMNEWLRVSPKPPPFQLFSTFFLGPSSLESCLVQPSSTCHPHVLNQI